ncbi:MAG: SDR family oxidoreductase [Myxococcota bacterium]
MSNVNKKVIVITGTSTGIGYLAALGFAEKGSRVFATMRDPQGKNRSRATSLEQAGVEVLPLDVTKQAEVDSAVSTVMKKTGRLDVVINNAGIMNIGLTEGFTIDQLQAQMEVNYLGVARMFRAVLPHMRSRQQGLVVTVSSLAGRLIFPAFHSYNSSKFAVEALAEGYRYELSPYGIDSVILEPGPFKTELVGNSPRPKDEAVLRQYGEFAQMPETVINGFDAFMTAHADGDCNPALVVTDLIKLVETPFGERPMRTVTGIDYGARALNEATDKFQKGVLEAMELQHLDPNHRSPATTPA